MAWTNIPTTDIDQDSPLTQPLMTALRDNIQYAWECTWHPYDMVYPGDGNDGVIYDSGVDGTVANVVSDDFADGFEYRFIFLAVSHNQTAETLQVEWYKATDAAYAAGVNFSASMGNADTFTGSVYACKPRIAQANFSAPASGIESGGLRFSDDAGFTDATSQKVLRARFSPSAGSIDAGKIVQERRRDVTGL